MTITIGVLGPQLVSVDGHEIETLAPQQRRVLSVLASHPGAIVARDQIMMSLWGSSTSKLLKGLQAYVSNIRQVLGTTAVEFVGTGYRLNIDPDNVDEVRFTLLIESGHLHLTAERYADAAAAFGEAVALWRGDPYDDLPNGEFAARRAGLRESLLSAEEGSVRARLEMVRDSQQAGALIAVTAQAYAEHPRRERRVLDHIRCLLMCGRATDATQVAHDYRKRLKAEVGAEPGPEFVEVAGRIGRRDQLPLSAAWGSGEHVPSFTMPLIGRALEVDLACTLLTGDAVGILTFTGPAGVGKTRLAGAIAESMAHTLPGGVVWLEPNTTQDAESLLAGLAEQLQIKARSAELRQRIPQALSVRRTLVVADGADPKGITSAAAILLSTGSMLSLLVTAEQPLALASEQVIELQPLSTAAVPGGSPAARFVAEAIETLGAAGRVDMESIERHVRNSSGLPMDLHQVAISLMTQVRAS